MRPVDFLGDFASFDFFPLFAVTFVLVTFPFLVSKVLAAIFYARLQMADWDAADCAIVVVVGAVVAGTRSVFKWTRRFVTEIRVIRIKRAINDLRRINWLRLLLINLIKRKRLLLGFDLSTL